MKNFTCNGCTERHVGCHGTCEKYKMEKAVYDKQQAKIKKEKQGDIDYYCYQQSRYERLNKLRNRQKSNCVYSRRLGY